MAVEKTEEKKKGFFKSLFTDGQWDWDLSKIGGFLLIILGCFGFWFGKDNFQWCIATGAGLLGWKNKIEGV